MSEQVSKDRLDVLLARARFAASTLNPPCRASEIANAFEELLALREETRWRDCGPEYPAPNEIVLVSSGPDIRGVEEARYSIDDEGAPHWFLTSDDAHGDPREVWPSKWRPLPAPPREVPHE